PWTFCDDAARAARARDYARQLRERYSLPLVDAHPGVLITREGLALGVTFGESSYDASRFVPAPGFTLPDDSRVITDGDYEEYDVDGVRYARMRGSDWQRWHAGTNAPIWPDGAYSVLFPRNDRPVVSEMVVESGGRIYPV